MWALGTRQARNILAGRGGLHRAAWEGFCWGAGLGLVAVLLSNAPDALAAGGALEGPPLFSGQTAWFLLKCWPVYLVTGVLGGGHAVGFHVLNAWLLRQ